MSVSSCRLVAARGPTLTRLALLVAFVATACGTTAAPGDGTFVEDSDPDALTWVSPGATLVVGEPIALAVATQNPAARVVHFALDEQEVGACDATDAGDDCHADALFQWTATTDVPGRHTLRATVDLADGSTQVATQAIDVAPMLSSSDDPEADPSELDPLGSDALLDDGTGEIVDAITSDRGYLDPSSRAHSLCAGEHWSMTGQRVVLAGGARIDGSSAAAARCMIAHGASVRRYADLRNVSRASVVAQLVRAGDCSAVGWRAAPLPSALCAAVTHESRAACAAHMRASADFAIDVLTRYLALPSVRAFHRHDPPRMALALEGRTRAACSRRDAWHLLESRAGSISAYVAAYNAYRTWEQRVPASADVVQPIAGVSSVSLVHEGSTGALTMIDLCAPGVRARVTDYRQPKATVARWAQETHVDVAANGEFFCLGCEDWVYGRARGNNVDWPANLQQHAGEVHPYWQFGSGVTQAVADGRLSPSRGAHDVIGGHDVLIEGGRVVPIGANSFTSDPRPRTAYGISVDRRTFFLYVTMDGVRVMDIASHMLALAARAHAATIDFATNEDGGGSSQLYVGHAMFTGDGRQVRNHLGFSTSAEGAPDSCPDL